jgi:hypothetical protein
LHWQKLKSASAFDINFARIGMFKRAGKAEDLTLLQILIIVALKPAAEESINFLVINV